MTAVVTFRWCVSFLLALSSLHPLSARTYYMERNVVSSIRSKLPPSHFTKPVTPKPSLFDVTMFGAKGDGKADDTKAFEQTWAAACQVETATVVVPSGYIFLIRPITFSGVNCKKNIVFQVEGTIIGPTSFSAWKPGMLYQWILFTKVSGVVVKGKGVLDGRGSIWWQKEVLDDEAKWAVPINGSIPAQPPALVGQLSSKIPTVKPTALWFYGSYNVTVTGIKIMNSPQCHLKFDECVGVSVSQMTILSPANSLNTDGIHLQNSKDVTIHTSDLACGDDCISIQTGCSNVMVRNVSCGPGHGISIGGLGRDNSKACVSNVTVRDVVMRGTMTGARIKTWQGGSGAVEGVTFSNVEVHEVQFPIVIDQYYCDRAKCGNQTWAVALSGITFEKVKGTYTVKPVHLACSDTLPCVGVTLSSIELTPVQQAYHLSAPFCWNTFGELLTPSLPPILCVQAGHPLRSGTLASPLDSCLSPS